MGGRGWSCNVRGGVGAVMLGGVGAVMLGGGGLEL